MFSLTTSTVASAKITSKVNFKTSKRVATKARAGFSVNAAASGDTLDKVRGIISEQLGTDLDAVAADSKFVDLGADSLDTVEIMMALEEQFEITLDEEGAEKIGTVQEAADMIQTQMDA
ncbi:unnamed protein product [Bathycoccus prasinos]